MAEVNRGEIWQFSFSRPNAFGFDDPEVRKVIL
jgi:hypothetical protein